MSRTTPIYHCPFCAEQDLRPVADPEGAWVCGDCVRTFSVLLHRTDREDTSPRREEDA